MRKSKSYLWSESAYETKVMLESVHRAISEALDRLWQGGIRPPSQNLGSGPPSPAQKTVINLKDGLCFIEKIQEKYAHVKCPQVGLSDEDYNEMQGADDNRP